MIHAHRLRPSRRALLGALALGCPLLTLQPAAAQFFTTTVDQIGPERSTLDATDPDGASGGRVNGLAAVPGDNQTFYAASEWGGLFKSTDGARTWSHLPGHLPVATWDVEVDPANTNRVYATSLYDGRVNSIAGINVSTDGGQTWTHPPTATPPDGFCADPERREEPSAFGIAIDPADSRDVYVGTNCGLAISDDRGATWRFVDPTPADGGDDVWDIVVHHDGTIDLCGDDGHRRSTDGGATWSTATGVDRLPGGRCSITASPDETHVLFAVSGTTIFETDDGGGAWPVTYANPSRQGRIPFVATSQRTGAGFDLWFGDVSLHRGTCTTPVPPTPGGLPRCTTSSAWAGPFTRSAGAHDDMGEIVFDTEASADACPLLMSSDGGVYFNTRTTSPDCHTPVWEQPDITPQALWNFDFVGIRQAGAAAEDLYFGNQDTGTFGTRQGGAAQPAWNNQRCCDGFDVAGEANRVLSTVCCFGGGRSTRLFISNPGLTGGAEINAYPPGNLRGFQQLDSIQNFGTDDYVVITGQGVFVTTDIGANPVAWTELGDASSPAGACGVQVARRGSATTFFVKSGGCNGETGGTLWRYAGTAPGGTWQQVTRAGAGLFGVYSVDANDPDRIIASDLGGAAAPEMVMTTNGGTSWQALPQLDQLMTGNGAFRYQTRRGPLRFTAIGGYPQPTLVAFDPDDQDIVVAAAADSGVFLSDDSGQRWRRVTDPLNPRASGIPHVPRARYAHFDHDTPNVVRIYLGTQGRGIWRVNMHRGGPFAVDGKLTFLRVHDVATKFGPPSDQLDAEVIAQLDSSDKSFGFQLRPDAQAEARGGMLDTLREAFNRDRRVRLEWIRNGPRTGQIIRVIQLD